MKNELTFLVVIDDSDEMHDALRYASIRAARVNGRVAFVATIETLDFTHWKAVEDIAEEEFREEAEKKMLEFQKIVSLISKKEPRKYIMKGDRATCILELINSKEFISNLILASSSSSRGPGPLITEFTGKYRSKLKVPLTIIPANLSEEEIDNLF